MRKFELKFIKNLVIFTLIFFAIFFAFNNYAFSVIKKNISIFVVEKEFDDFVNKGNKYIEYAFFGDSLTSHGFNPKYLDYSYNFGSPGQRYVETYCRVKELLSSDVKIKNAFIEINTGILSSHEKAFSGEKINFYKDCLPLREISKIRESNLVSTYLQSKFPIIGSGENFIISQFGLYEKEDSFRGHMKFSSFLDMNSGAAIKNFKSIEENKYNLSEDSLDYLFEIIDMFLANDVKINFLKYPMHREWYRAMKGRDKEIYEEFYEKLEERFPDLSYKIFDYSDYFFEEDKYYHDFAHLSYLGANTFSEVLSEDIRQRDLEH